MFGIKKSNNVFKKEQNTANPIFNCSLYENTVETISFLGLN